MQEADYVIVGAGSAGCALAWRLSEAGASVIVIEAGGSDWGPFIQMPAALSYPMNMARYDWGYSSEPEPHMDNRRMHAPRGRVIGGSSSINGMVYVRGNPVDFDNWEKSGASGWSFADILPYYKRMENWHGAPPNSPLRNWRGSDGPLHITRGRMENPLYDAFINAGVEAGYAATQDYNGEAQEGFGAMERTIYKGERWSAANAYLKPATKKHNCQIIQGLASKITFDGKIANGVEILQGKSVTHINAKREVIISASAFNSPKLLMLSGIGPADHLKQHGIEVLVDSPGVGQNLQDHLELYIQFGCREPITLHKYWNLFSKARIGLQWLLTKSGPGATNHFESTGFIRSRAGIKSPDLQYHFLPMAIRYDGKGATDGHGFQAHVGPMNSPSKGSVSLASKNPRQAPEIRFNYMSHEDDWRTFRAGIRLTREIISQPAMAKYVTHEIQPGEAAQSDEALDAVIREKAESAYHPCGTVRMGANDDPLAVLDNECRVKGVDRLRVVDSSIFPNITNGNINGPSIMVGEKAADHILGRNLLPQDDSAPHFNSGWKTQQR